MVVELLFLSLAPLTPCWQPGLSSCHTRRLIPVEVVRAVVINMAEWQDMFGDDISDQSEDEGGVDNKNQITSEEISLSENNEINHSPPFIIKYIPGIGGMRGVFAARDLPAGTLVMAECPTLTWKGHFSSQEVLRQTITAICCQEKAYDATKALHPFILEDADQGEIEAMRELWGEALPHAVSDLSTASQGTISEDEILRVSLVLQHNAYGSGFYRTFSLINHACEPNCTKLYPSTDKGWRKASELWTTCDVKAGQELTICYNHIREMPSHSISHFLLEHHRFKCHCRIHLSDQLSSGKYGDIDEWIVVIEERVEYYEDQLKQCALLADNKKFLELLLDIILACEEIMSEICAHMSLSESITDYCHLLELMKIPVEFHSDHIFMSSDVFDLKKKLSMKERDSLYMLVRLHKIVVSAACTSVQELGSKKDAMLSNNKQFDGCNDVYKQLLTTAEKYLTHSLSLAPLQCIYLGGVHIDVAQTFLDIAEGLRCLSSLNSDIFKSQDYSSDLDLLQQLYRKDTQKFSWAQSNKKTHQLMTKIRTEGERIANLYRPRYDLFQERLVDSAIQKPEVYL